jgi:hypothetical protein
VRAEIEQFLGDGRRETEATCRVFSIDDEEIDLMLFNDVAEMFAHDATASASENIPYKKNAHMQTPRDRIKISYSL